MIKKAEIMPKIKIIRNIKGKFKNKRKYWIMKRTKQYARRLFIQIPPL